MSRRKRRRSSARKVGAPPGTLIYTGEGVSHEVALELFTYGPEVCERSTVTRLEGPLAPPPGQVRWVNLNGVHDLPALEVISAALGLHPLTLEDIASVHQRPKFETYGDYHYVVIRMIRSVDGPDGIPTLDDEQLSILVAGNTVVTFQERPGDVLDALRERIEVGKGRLRKMGPDYLLYAILDLVIDHYFAVLETFTTRLDELEPELLSSGDTTEHLERVHAIRQELAILRRAIWPTRDMLGALLRSDDEAITQGVRTYLRDAHDHAIQVLETVELLRETASTLRERHLALVSVRMNEVMQVLTIIATIFIPLTFLVGVYGMNFEHMPELKWRWGYAAVWGGMVALALGMLVYFRRRRWL